MLPFNSIVSSTSKLATQPISMAEADRTGQHRNRLVAIPRWNTQVDRVRSWAEMSEGSLQFRQRVSLPLDPVEVSRPVVDPAGTAGSSGPADMARSLVPSGTAGSSVPADLVRSSVPGPKGRRELTLWQCLRRSLHRRKYTYHKRLQCRTESP